MYKHDGLYLLVTVESVLPECIIVSYTDQNSGTQFQGALLQSQRTFFPINRTKGKKSLKSHNGCNYSLQRFVPESASVYLSQSGYANPVVTSQDHQYVNSVNESKDIPKQIRDNWGKVENVTSLSSQDKPHFGVQSRVIKTVTTIPADTDAHTSCTVLCDRPPIPPSWMFSPEEYSTNSKYRQAKANATMKFKKMEHFSKKQKSLSPYSLNAFEKRKKQKLKCVTVKTSKLNVFSSNFGTPFSGLPKLDKDGPDTSLQHQYVKPPQLKIKPLSIDITKTQISRLHSALSSALSSPYASISDNSEV